MQAGERPAPTGPDGPPAALPVEAGDAGFVLLSVLLAAALFLAAATSFAVKSQLLAMQAANRLEQARAEASVDGAVLFAIEALRPFLATGAPAASPAQAAPPAPSTPAPAAAAAPPVPPAARGRAPLFLDGRPLVCALSDRRTLEISAVDQGGLLDLNAASPDMLGDILSLAGFSGEAATRIAGAIVDFRDEDDVPAAGGASERALYREAGKPFGPRNAAFLDAAEIAQLPGLSPAAVDRLRPLVTVFNGQPSLDPTVMDRRARALLPAEIDGVEALSRWAKPSPRESVAIEALIRRTDGTVAALRRTLVTVADPSDALAGTAPNPPGAVRAPRILQWQTAVVAPSAPLAPSNSPLCAGLARALDL